MRTYSNPEVQKAVNDMFDNVMKADEIIATMRYNIESLGRREADKNRTSLKPEQKANLEANRGKHIYGSSHPLYKENQS